MPQALPTSSTQGPGVGSSSGVGARGLLRLVSPDELTRQEAQQRDLSAAVAPMMPDLCRIIRDRWEVARNHRNTASDDLNERMLRAQRMFQGKYDPEKLGAIRRFGGSEVYSRLVAVKCRGATALLRDVYLGPDRPWDIAPPADPDVPPEVRASILQLASSEAQRMGALGQPVDPDTVMTRVQSLVFAAQQAAKRKAMKQSQQASAKIDEILANGNFYHALAQFLIDLPLFPFAVIKGPVVRMVPRLTWQGGRPTMQLKPAMFWDRISPFDVSWTPGVSNIAEADIFERRRFTRTDLNDMKDLPGFNQEAVREVLTHYGSGGLRDWMDSSDSERAQNEGRENPNMNRSGLIDALEFHGRIQGSVLIDAGVPEESIPDPERDYAVQAWVVGSYVLKVQLSPSPRERHPYFVTSFEKVPGTIAGHALPDIIGDLQEVCNATLRSLVNNMAIASGPQVVVDDDRIANNETDEMYPWKRWHVNDGGMTQREPITFFQPNSNAQELLGVYQQITNLADELSAIPRYITGSERLGGAGRTASGLSMLMGNAEKVLQTVASNVDMDVMEPLLTQLYDMIMLTDESGLFTGEEEVRVRGVNVAVQRETERQKQLQFLQITANPIDAPIVGVEGRAKVLRAVASTLGLPDDVVPDEETIRQKQMMASMQPPQPGAPPGGPPGPGGSAAAAQGDQAPSPAPARLADHAPPMNSFQQGAPAAGLQKGA